MKKSVIVILILAVIAIVGGTAVFASQKRHEKPHPANLTRLPDGSHPLLQGEGSATPPSADTVALPKSVVDIKPVTILTYHSIEPKPAKKEAPMTLHYRIDPKVFEQQMKYLKDNGYSTITFNTLVHYVKDGTPIPEKSVVLTFDDGWKNQYTYGVPVLKKYGFTGTFFIITKMRTGGYMTWEDLADLKAGGFEIASHTETHPKLTKIDDAKLIQEVTQSKKTLEDKLGITVTTLAYPYYDHNQHVMDAVKNAGYIAARAGWGSFKNDANHLYEFTSQEVVNNANPFLSKRIPD